MDLSFKRRAFFICLVLVTGLTVLSLRVIALQVWDRKMTNQSHVPRFKKEEVIPASRGLIFDRKQTELAQNRPEATLVADLNHLNTASILGRAVAHRYARQAAGWNQLNDAEKGVILAKIRKQLVSKLSEEDLIKEHLAYATEIIGRELQIPLAELRQKIDSKSTRVVLHKRVREDDARHLEAELEKRRIQGFSFERFQRRYYPMPTLAPHLIGFNNEEGGCGIEKWMNDILSGRDGKRVMKSDENGLIYLTEAAKVTPPKMGKHVKLTLDMAIQAIIEEELEMAIDAYRAKKGSIIIADPHTGDILAMASRPHFDLNDKQNYSQAGTSFGIAAQYESGSVMKIVAMAGALDAGVANRESVVDCGWGSIYLYGHEINDHHDYGDLTFDGVLSKSSNTGVVRFADRLGRRRFYDYLYNFGFGQRTGFPIPGEAKGRIQNPTNMHNFTSATRGYGVSVSPLQLAMAYSVLANGGNLMKPRLIDSIIAYNGTELERKPLLKVHRVIGESTARKMCLALEQVVLNGTGGKAKVPGYRAGGKTGTAYKVDPVTKEYDPKRKFLTFAGILPVQDPRFVCIVTIDEPTGFEEGTPIGGGTIAAPVFSQVAGRVARFMNITPTEEIPDEESLALVPIE